MPSSFPPQSLADLAATVGERLRARGETVAVSESAAGGLISATLLSVPGASAFYRGGAVVYTAAARVFLTAAMAPPIGMRGATEAFARYEAGAIIAALGATWGIGETGAAGPTGNPYGDPAGHAWVSVAGPAGTALARNVLTGHADRAENMVAFSAAALQLLADALEAAG